MITVYGHSVFWNSMEIQIALGPVAGRDYGYASWYGCWRCNEGEIKRGHVLMVSGVFKILLVNGQHLQNVSDHKTDKKSVYG